MSWQVEFRGPYAGKSFVLNLEPNGEQFLGNRCDFMPKGIAIQDRHARIFSDGSGIYIEATDRAPLTLNGHSLSHPAPLTEGDWVAFGPVLYQVSLTTNTPDEIGRAHV